MINNKYIREIASYCVHHQVNSLDTLDRSLFLTPLLKAGGQKVH